MPRKTVEEMLRERAELDAAIAAEKARTQNYTPAMKMAEALHDRGCTFNHTDYCGWGYEDWNGPTHQRYLSAANRVLLEWDRIKTSDPQFVDKAVALILGATRP